MNSDRRSSKPALALAVAAGFLLAACAGAAATDQPTAAPTEAMITLADGLGREVVLAGPAQRIVSLAASNTEILFAVGAGAQVVGRDETSDYPPEAGDVSSIGSLFGDLNTEAIVALEPDLVLAAGTITPEQVQTIADLGIPVYYLANPLEFAGLYENLRIVGRLTGHETEAEALAESLKARVDRVVEAVAGAANVPVYYEVDGTDPASPWTVGAGTFQDVLISMAHGENIAADIEGWAQINLEELVARNPSVMFFGEGPWVPTTSESVAERAGWEAIAAVANGAIYGIDTNWIDRPGPRLVDALEMIAARLHPDLFP